MFRSRSWLIKNYAELGKTSTELGKEQNVSHKTILYWLEKYNIPRRHPAHKENKGENNYFWSGDNVSYAGLHHWLEVNKPKTGICDICNKYKKTTYANISGEYRRDINDFGELCYSCHCLFDKLNQTHKKQLEGKQ